MENFNKQTEQENFIKYWDKVINLWLAEPEEREDSEVIDARRPLPEKKKTKKKEEEEDKKECYYKEGFEVNMENEQMAFFNNEKLKKLLCPAHLPEPYWGNPYKDKCSIVVVDYNPAGGTDMNPHSYKGTIDGKQFPSNTIIKYVKENRYSNFATNFPIWKKDLPKGMEWLCSYGGRNWWLKKKEWIQHLVGDNIKVEEVPPFAIELCGWHSPNWPDNTDAFQGEGLKETIKNRFALPLLEAIDNSKSHLAICIGAQFKPSILKKFLPDLVNITGCIFDEDKLGGEGICYPDNPGKKDIPGDESISVTINKDKKETTRYYRVYDVKGEGENNHHIILNTFAPGSNHHPAKEYWDFENKLIEAIKLWKTGNNTSK